MHVCVEVGGGGGEVYIKRVRIDSFLSFWNTDTGYDARYVFISYK